MDSTRLPRKLLLSGTGHPLIWHTVQNAKKSALAKRIIVATDSEEIRDAVKNEVEVVMTGVCDSGTHRVAEACHILGLHGAVVNIQGDEPTVDIDCVDELFEAIDPCTTKSLLKKWDVATLATHSSLSEYKNPDVVKVVLGNCFNALYFSRSPIPYGQLQYGLKHIGVYAYSTSFLRSVWRMDMISSQNPSENLEQLQWIENGKNIRVLVRDIKSTGIDTLNEYDRFVSNFLGTDIPSNSDGVSFDWRHWD